MPRPFSRIRRSRRHSLVLLALGLSMGFAGGQEGFPEAEKIGGVPDPPGEESFSALIENSPFLRPLDLSRSLVLTGVARIDDSVFAILHDRDSKESHFVTGSKGPEGWQLLGIEGDIRDLESVTARISAAGGSVYSVRYDPEQIEPNSRSSGGNIAIPRDQAARIAHEARNFRRGLSSDGFPNAPPRELADKFGKLSETERGRIIYQMDQHRRKGLGGEERQKIFTGLVERAARGR